jgi:hypothetical protein
LADPAAYDTVFEFGLIALLGGLGVND